MQDNGRETEPVFTKGTKGKGSESAITPAAAFLTADILKDKGRFMPLYREIFKDETRRTAFKTGASSGKRDAWTAPVTKKYTLAVWFKDPSGRQDRELAGLETAAKAAIRIMRKADAGAGEWHKAPPNVGRRGLRTLPGAIPNSLRTRTREDYYIKEISSGEPCRIRAGATGHTELRRPRA